MSDISVFRVLTRGVPASFGDCERVDRTVDIDVGAARTDHVRYIDAVSAHAKHTSADADERYPDCMFIEDTVVVLTAYAAVVARPGVESRRGEVEGVIPSLRGMRLFRVDAPATLDGGDVLRCGKRVFVGLSARTNAAGVSALEVACAGVGLAVVRIVVPRGLHLKSACTLVDETTLVHDPAVGLDLSLFSGLDHIASAEPAGANVLALGDGRVLVSAAAPRTAETLDSRGNRVELIPAQQVHRADGGLTCCSVRIPPPDGWCT
jgi:dimethylargininase